MAFTEDFTDFFDTADFGVTATVSGSSVSVIFDKEWVEVNGSEGYRPVIMYPTSAVTAAVGDSVTVDSTSFIVEILDTDGVGVTRAILRAA
jgi:hypothetical protein